MTPHPTRLDWLIALTGLAGCLVAIWAIENEFVVFAEIADATLAALNKGQDDV